MTRLCKKGSERNVLTLNFVTKKTEVRYFVNDAYLIRTFPS